MKKTFILIFLLGLFQLTVQAQDEGVKQEGAHQAEYNADAQERDRSGQVDSRRLDDPDDQAGGNAGEQDNVTGTSTPANVNVSTDTRTTSSSGSPGVLVDDNQADGTNTMQRAEPNIGGSPIPGSVSKPNRQASDKPSDNKIFSNEKKTDKKDSGKRKK